MKYDRPVSELLRECAGSLAEPFTRLEVLSWFRRHYPDVRESTVSAHIFGLTDSDAPSRDHYQFANHAPVLERVGRGLYQRARGGTSPTKRAASPPQPSGLRAARPVATKADVLLIGCVKSKRPRAAPARDLYTSALFTRRRRYAETSNATWFVVSSRWGLVAPDEVIAPYDVYLGDMPTAYRRAWAELVVAQLALQMTLRDAVVEIHAGDHYVGALRPARERLGAQVVDPVDAHSMGETLAWYDHEPGHDVETLLTHITDPTASLTPDELRALPRRELSDPGLYSWWGDERGAQHLTTGLGHLVEPGLIYAGQAGATRWPSGKASSNTLRGRLAGMHLGGRAGLSTFRRTLAAVLAAEWGGLDQDRLTRWMEIHLKVIPVGFDDADTLGDVEASVLEVLDPPLNLRDRPATPLRHELSRLRASLGG